ncbi:prostaglandin E receptor 1c (subtype EP1) [Genypterus blacodes]|uniref:prostaglandin E receptor 1c (subtype EP1) n=1 Tax=Genypterus blacodes TaxID=154954 RepID=UPI003F763B12
MDLLYSSPTPSILHHDLEINSSTHPSAQLRNSSARQPFTSSSLGMSCFTMTFGAISNITALVILIKSRIQSRRHAKVPFLLLVGALLVTDLGGHLIPGGFAMYLHVDYNQRLNVTRHATKPTEIFCQVFGASMVFFGLCPLLIGSAMAVERCVGITQPLRHNTSMTMTRVRRVVLLLASLALLLALLPVCTVGTYTVQFPGTWCFLPLLGSRSVADTNLILAFSCLGLCALTLSLFCNILSGLALLQARVRSKNVNPKAAATCIRRASNTSFGPVLFSLDVEMMVQLAVITVVSCVCWIPFLIRILWSVADEGSTGSVQQTGGLILLSLRMASWNQILDPWVYILLRRAVLYRVCCTVTTQRSMLRAAIPRTNSSRQSFKLQ